MRGLGVLVLLFTTFPALGGDDALPRGEPISRVACREVPGKSYALYLPGAYTAGRRWPVLYLLDPRGRGMAPMPLVTAAAERFGWIVASSNDSRGDVPVDDMKAAFLAMLADTHARLALDDRRVVLGGFSAGARGAAFMAQILRTPPAAVIGCGAGFLDEFPPTKETPFAWFGIVGKRDFNRAEMKRLAREMARLGIRHRLLEFSGGHEWPPAEALTEAITWIEALEEIR